MAVDRTPDHTWAPMSFGLILRPQHQQAVDRAHGLQGRGVLPDICTSQERVTSANDVFGMLRSGQMPIAYATRTRNVDPKDLTALEHLRAACPGREGDNEIDMKVARHLLTTPELYARALGGAPKGSGSSNEARRGALSAKVGCGEAGREFC